MDKLVSVGMITYNHSSFIAEAIESCLSQTYTNIEICISDDCSTDDTVNIIKDYLNRYPNKIKLFVHEKNMGKYTYAINGNSMYDLCEGEYIAILEGDDVMLPTRIEEQVKFLDQNLEYIAVSHECETFEHETGKVIDNYFSALDTTDRTTSCLISKGNNVHTPTVMMRNMKDKIRTSYHLKAMLDWYLFIELSMYGKIGHQNKILTRYRRHTTGVSRNRKIMNKDEYITLALVESNYPEYLKEVNFRRLAMYHQNIKEGNSTYIKGLSSQHILYFLFLVKRKLKILSHNLLKK